MLMGNLHNAASRGTNQSALFVSLSDFKIHLEQTFHQLLYVIKMTCSVM